MNKKQFDYWKNEVFIGLHGHTEVIADIKAHIVCQMKEINNLKNEIKKLKLKYKKFYGKIK